MTSAGLIRTHAVSPVFPAGTMGAD